MSLTQFLNVLNLKLALTFRDDESPQYVSLETAAGNDVYVVVSDGIESVRGAGATELDAIRNLVSKISETNLVLWSPIPLYFTAPKLTYGGS